MNTYQLDIEKFEDFETLKEAGIKHTMKLSGIPGMFGVEFDSAEDLERAKELLGEQKIPKGAISSLIEEVPLKTDIIADLKASGLLSEGELNLIRSVREYDLHYKQSGITGDSKVLSDKFAVILNSTFTEHFKGRILTESEMEERYNQRELDAISLKEHDVYHKIGGLMDQVSSLYCELSEIYKKNDSGIKGTRINSFGKCKG